MQKVKRSKSRFEQVPVAEVLQSVSLEALPRKARAHGDGRNSSSNVVRTGPHKVHPYSVPTPDAFVEE